jgi:hypothetical protein
MPHYSDTLSHEFRVCLHSLTPLSHYLHLPDFVPVTAKEGPLEFFIHEVFDNEMSKLYAKIEGNFDRTMWRGGLQSAFLKCRYCATATGNNSY